MSDMKTKLSTALWCDLKTDKERAAWLLLGRGFETGVVSISIQNELAMAYSRLIELDTGIDRGAWADVKNATGWVDELRGDEPEQDWVSLTDEDIAEAVGSPLDEVYLADFRKVEAKLKELNT